MTDQDTFTLAQLEARYAHIASQLEQANTVHEREEVKQSIIALFRQVQGAIDGYSRLRDATRELVDAWKSRAADDAVASDAPAREVSTASPTPSSSTTRVDHLGASTYIEKGWTRLSLDQPREAEEALLRALELAPEHVEAETLLAWSLALQQRFDEAELRAARVVERSGGYALATVVRAFVALQQGQPASAISLLENVRDFASHDRRALLYGYLYLGMSFGAQGDVERARQCFEDALQRGPNLLQAAWELGRVQWGSGNESSAMHTWREAARSNKFSPWGKRCAEMVMQVERGESPVALR